MDILPESLIDLHQIQSINILGRGGKEAEITRCLFPQARRSSNSSLWDCELDCGEKIYKIEIKKQINDQWFDLGKYYHLTEENRQVILLFILHDNHMIDKVVAIHLGAFIDILLTDKKYKRYGWQEDILRFAAECKQPENSPELQFKAKVKIREFAQDPLYKDRFQIVYERQGILNGG